MNRSVAVDSNMLTYLHDATSPAFDPAGDVDVQLATQKVALVRILFYWDGALKIVPTVSAEYQRIRNAERRQSHDVLTIALFDEIVDLNIEVVDQRKNYYLKFHSDEDDCRILAEAEVGGIDVLLSYDTNLRSHLGQRCDKPTLMGAQEFWEGLRIPQGASPRVLPGNPLRERTWWKW